MIKLITIASLVLGFSFAASADTAEQKQFTVKKVMVREIPSEQHIMVAPTLSPDCSSGLNSNISPMGILDDLDVTLDKIINLGKKVWNLVLQGRPVINIKSDIATAMPQGTKCWTDLENWSAPESKTYEATFENGFGAEVVNFKYRVIYVYGGGLNGKGKYIGYATMNPVNVDVTWGFSINATANVPVVFNMGSKQDPVGGMQMQMNYVVDTAITNIQESQAYFVSGKGEFKQLD